MNHDQGRHKILAKNVNFSLEKSVRSKVPKDHFKSGQEIHEFLVLIFKIWILNDKPDSKKSV